MPATRDRPLPRDVTDLVGFRLFRLTNTLGAAAERQYIREHGLKLTEWRCLSIVARRGAVSAAEICTAIRIDKAWVSRTTARLLARGLIEAQDDPADARRTLYRASAEGRRVAQRVLDLALKRHAHLFAHVSPADREAFERVLDELQARADLL